MLDVDIVKAMSHCVDGGDCVDCELGALGIQCTNTAFKLALEEIERLRKECGVGVDFADKEAVVQNDNDRREA